MSYKELFFIRYVVFIMLQLSWIFFFHTIMFYGFKRSKRSLFSWIQTHTIDYFEWQFKCLCYFLGKKNIISINDLYISIKNTIQKFIVKESLFKITRNKISICWFTSYFFAQFHWWFDNIIFDNSHLFVKRVKFNRLKFWLSV